MGLSLAELSSHILKHIIQRPNGSSRATAWGQAASGVQEALCGTTSMSVADVAAWHKLGCKGDTSSQFP